MSLILNIYIQKSFWENFAHFYEANDDYWQDFKQWTEKFLPKFRLYVECEQGDFFQLANENPFIKNLHNSINISGLYFFPNLSTEIHNLPFYQTENYPFRFFFTHENKETCTTLAQRFGFMYFTLSELANQWETFYSLRPDAKMVVTPSPNQPNRFDSWERLREFTHPLNSILIFDHYILQDKTNRQGQLIRKKEDNLFQLLQNIIVPSSLEIPISIIIFAEKAKFHRWNLSTNSLQTSNTIQLIYEDILAELNRLFQDRNVSFNFSIVEYDVTTHQTVFDNPNYNKIHDRYLITNYFCIESSGGFGLLKPSSDALLTTKITFDFHFHSLNTNYITFVLNNIKSYIGIAGITYYPNTVPVTHPFLT